MNRKSFDPPLGILLHRFHSLFYLELVGLQKPQLVSLSEERIQHNVLFLQLLLQLT